MKTRINLFPKILIACAIVMYSCGGEQKEKAPAETSGSEFLKEETPAYDAKAIDANAPVAELTIKTIGNTMAEMKYDLGELRVKAGSTVKLTLINLATDSSMQHNFVLIDKDALDKVAAEGLKAGLDNQFVPAIDEVLIATKLLMPAETTTIIFTAPPAGEYKFVCTYPGHAGKMNGKFMVE